MIYKKIVSIISITLIQLLSFERMLRFITVALVEILDIKRDKVHSI